MANSEMDYMNIGGKGIKVKSFDVSVPAASTYYDYTNNKPSDFVKPLSACSVSGGGCIIVQVTSNVVFFKEAISSNSVLRIMYQSI